MKSNAAVKLTNRRRGNNDNGDYDQNDNPKEYNHNRKIAIRVIGSLIFGIDGRRFLYGQRINIRGRPRRLRVVLRSSAPVADKGFSADCFVAVLLHLLGCIGYTTSYGASV